MGWPKQRRPFEWASVPPRERAQGWLIDVSGVYSAAVRQGLRCFRRRLRGRSPARSKAAIASAVKRR